jgi:hypothetical protein
MPLSLNVFWNMTLQPMHLIFKYVSPTHTVKEVRYLNILLRHLYVKTKEMGDVLSNLPASFYAWEISIHSNDIYILYPVLEKEKKVNCNFFYTHTAAAAKFYTKYE